MSELLTPILTGITAFTATNLDDIVILTLFFSQVNATFRRWHIVAGQYLGFTALVLASLPGFFGGFIVPRPWIGLLGLVPIAIGISSLLNREEDESVDSVNHSQCSGIPILNVQTHSVAAIAFANGSDNISIYVPLFANSDWESMLIIIGIFFVLVGVWCYAAYQIINQQAIASLINSYANQIVPFVLMAIGAFIVWESDLLTGITTVANNISVMVDIYPT